MTYTASSLCWTTATTSGERRDAYLPNVYMKMKGEGGAEINISLRDWASDEDVECEDNNMLAPSSQRRRNKSSNFPSAKVCNVIHHLHQQPAPMDLSATKAELLTPFHCYFELCIALQLSLSLSSWKQITRDKKRNYREGGEGRKKSRAPHFCLHVGTHNSPPHRWSNLSTWKGAGRKFIRLSRWAYFSEKNFFQQLPLWKDLLLGSRLNFRLSPSLPPFINISRCWSEHYPFKQKKNPFASCRWFLACLHVVLSFLSHRQ